ncbi:MAG TPA: universal stress protein [Thermoanaerobaculia bacterium]
MKPFQRILMATDFSEASIPAWNRALSLATENAAALFVVHAYEPPNAVQASMVAPGVYEEWSQNLRAGAEQKLDLLVAEARKLGLQAHRSVAAGHVDEAIIKTAQELDADLIVMGTHGRKGASRMFLGSVAARVMATAPCAVLTVRLPERPKLEKVAVGA